MLLKSTLYLAVAAMCLTAQPHAQERAAAGAIDTQMTWSALKSSVDTARAESKGAHDRIDQIMTCNAKQMIYSPNTSGKDLDGCVAITDLKRVLECGKENKIFNGTSCVDVASTGGLRWGASGNILACGYLYPNPGNIQACPPNSGGGATCSTKGQRCHIAIRDGLCGPDDNTINYNFNIYTCQ